MTRRSLPILLFLWLCVASRGSEAPPAEGSNPGIWEEGIGSGFRADALEAGFSLGAGFGTTVIGTTERHDFFEGAGRLGWIFEDVIGKGHFFQGNPEVLVGIFAVEQFHPENRCAIGGAAFFRYNFVTETPWVPFVEWGMGLSWTDIGPPDLDQRFQFNLQPGCGTHYFLGERMALTFNYTWLHFSDAGMTNPNHGTNTQMFLLGLTWCF